MAQTQSSFLFNFVFMLTLVLFLLSSTVYPLSPPNHHQDDQHYQDLDVSASIQKTLQDFSTQKISPPTTTTSTAAALSFLLYPLDSIRKPNYQSYDDLTISRLATDAARSKFLNFKLQLALSKPEYKTDIHLFKELEAQVTPTTSGWYAAKIGVGQPVREFHLLMDTGSDLNWLQCKPCLQCLKQSDPIFDPSKSSTYKPLLCDLKHCTSLGLTNCSSRIPCLYAEVYADKSFSVGVFATETLSFGSSGSVDNVAIVCGLISRGDFGGLSGVLGLGGSVFGLPSQVNATSFSYCLVDIDSNSSSTLEFNSAPPNDSVIIPLVKNPKSDIYYYVELTGITVGVDQISIPPSVYQIGKDGTGGIIVDSGTWISRLETRVYNSLRDSFVKYTQNLTSTSGFEYLDTCYDLSKLSSSNVCLPKMSFQFSGGKTLSLPPENYFIPVNSKGKFCLAFAKTPLPISIIGNTQQQGFRVTYDLGKKLIGFSPNKC